MEKGIFRDLFLNIPIPYLFIKSFQLTRVFGIEGDCGIVALKIVECQLGGTKLVINGIKIATCSVYTFYELDNEPLLTIEDYNFILNSEDKPVAITKMLKVTIILMNEISELFATAEEKVKEIGPTDICVINMSLFSW